MPDGPPIPNKRGKPSRHYRLVAVPDSAVSAKTPKWRLFEQRCIEAKKDPREVLWVLLSKCRSKKPGDSDSYGDPDLFAAGLFFTMHSAPRFLHSLFNGGGPPCLETEVANLIGRNDGLCLETPDTTNGHLPSFEKVWEVAKFYVGSALQNRNWRYNCNPMVAAIDPASPIKGKVVMRSRWHKGLSNEATGQLYFIDKIISTYPGEFFPSPIARKRSNELISKLSVLLHDRGEDMTAATVRVLTLLKWLWFEDDGTENGTWEWNATQRDAASWITAQTHSPAVVVESFAEAWARRFQERLSRRPTWALVNKIFQVTGDLPMPEKERLETLRKLFGWNPKDDAKRPQRVGDGCEYDIDYWHQESLRTQQRTDAPKTYSQHHDVTPAWWAQGYDWGD